MKYYEIRELRNRMYKVKEDIRNDVIEEFLLKHKGEPEASFPGVDVSIHFHHNNEIVDIFDKNLLGVTLENETPEVYQMAHSHPMISKDVPIIKIVFAIKSYVKRSEDVLGIGDEKHTFDTYEEFLSFVDEKTCGHNMESDKPFFVSLHDRKSNVSIANIFGHRSAVSKGIPNIPGFSINMLSVYKNLTDTVKEDIDKLLCPITLSKKDVEDHFDLDFVNVYVDREELVKSVFQTDKWNAVIDEALTVTAKDINKARTK